MCPSEVSDIEVSVWQAYRDRGVMVFAIASEDPLDNLLNFRDQMGISFPILFDGDGSVHAQYTQQNAVPAAYPEDWIIGSDGRVAYVNNIYDIDAMKAVIEQDL